MASRPSLPSLHPSPKTPLPTLSENVCLFDSTSFFVRSPQAFDREFSAQVSALPSSSSVPFSTPRSFTPQTALDTLPGFISPHPVPQLDASASASVSTCASLSIASNSVISQPQLSHPSAFSQAPAALPLPPLFPPPRTREKRHGCWMCHKCFDRPSTLRKHLLVHTGEKPHVCETCGRRFGVHSNLNRHARGCVLRPIHASRASGLSAEGESTDTKDISFSPTDTDNDPFSQRTCERSNMAAASRPVTARPKRTRRPPSPSRWIPASLVTFNLTPLDKCCPTPLAPVIPCDDFGAGPEERNSYENDWPTNPYHPREWRGRLPGPGLLPVVGQPMTI